MFLFFQRLASGGKDGTIRLWDLEIRNRRVIDSSKVSTLQFGGKQEVWRLAYNSNGSLIAAGGSGGSVRVWNTESLKLVDSFQPHDSYIKSLQFTDHDTKLITSGWRSRNGPTEFRILDLNDSSPTRHRGRTLRPALNGNWHSGVAIHDELMIVGSAQGVLLFDDLKSPASSFAIQAQEALPASDQDIEENKPLDLRCLAISPDGNLLATGSDDYAIRLWNAKTGERLAILSEHKESVNSLQFYRHQSRGICAPCDPAELRLVSSGSDGTVRVWLVDEILAHAPLPVPGQKVPLPKNVDSQDLARASAADVLSLNHSAPEVQREPATRSPNRSRSPGNKSGGQQSLHSELALAVIFLAVFSLLLTFIGHHRTKRAA